MTRAYTSTLVTARYTSASPSVTWPLPSINSLHVSMTSTPGCVQADFDSSPQPNVPTKTQVMWLGSGQLVRQVVICDLSVLSTEVKPFEFARDLGVVINSQLSRSAQVIAAFCRSDYYHLRQLRPAAWSLTSDILRRL